MPIQSVIKLTPRHLKIVDYCIEGLTPKDIASKLLMSSRQVGIIINSASFQHQLSIRRSSFEKDIDEKLAETEVHAADILKSAAITAAKRVVLGMGSQNEGLAIRAAESILDRSGNAKLMRAEPMDKNPTIHISHDDLELLNETLRLENEILEKHKPVVSMITNSVVSTNGEEQKQICSDGQVDASSSPFSSKE